MANGSSKLLVLGGGITGLAAAYLAAKAGRQVTVLESSPELGGLLQTFPVGGNRLEYYYHHHFTHDVEFRWLLRELGLEDRLEFHDTTMGVFRDGRLYPFNGARDLLRFKPLSFLDKVRFGLSSLYLAKVMDWRKNENVAAMDWFRRHAGKTTTAALWEPMLKIKFGPYADQVPVAWMAGRMRQRLNSRRGGDEKLGYLRGSLNVLLEALVAELRRRNVNLIVNARVEHLAARDGLIESVTSSQGTFTADAVLVTVPTPVAARLLQPHLPEYAAGLAGIEYFGALCAVLELSRPFSPIYWLNVADPGYPFGGVIEHTNLVPASEYQGRHIVYLSRYFAASDALATAPEAKVLETLLPPLKRIVPDFPDAAMLRAQVFRTMTAAVVCDRNFSKRVPRCRTPLKNLFLANMTHIYPDERSCNNSVRVAAEACRIMGIDSSSVPRGPSLSGLIGME